MDGVGRKLSWVRGAQHQDAPSVSRKGADRALGKDAEAKSTLIRTLSRDRGGATSHHYRQITVTNQNTEKALYWS